MDKGQDKAGRWSWLPAFMPGVARLMAEKRQALGKAHVDECWRRGVVQCEAGWFFAREGALAVGVPSEEFADLVRVQATSTEAVLMLRDVAHGA